jgi:hypothetical protein
MLPIGSMYGIYANIWGILMVNVTIYSSTMDPMGYSTCIATSYGIQSEFFPHPSADARRHIPSICAIKRYQKILCYSSYSHPSHFKGILNIKYSLLNNYIYRYILHQFKLYSYGLMIDHPSTEQFTENPMGS